MNREIANLKADCLESFTAVEECRQLARRNDDPNFEDLLRQRPLDPARSHSWKVIQTHYHYIDNEMSKIDGNLDEEWDAYQKRQNRPRYVCMLVCVVVFLWSENG